MDNNSPKYHIGDCKAFKQKDNKYLEMGEIIDIIETKNSYQYEFKVLLDNGFEIFFVDEKDIIILPTPKKPENCKWVQENIEKINKSFGKDVSDYLIEMCDSKESLKDFEDTIFMDEKYHQIVDGKHIFLIG